MVPNPIATVAPGNILETGSDESGSATFFQANVPNPPDAGTDSAAGSFPQGMRRIRCRAIEASASAKSGATLPFADASSKNPQHLISKLVPERSG
jgi:hypothetical protein